MKKIIVLVLVLALCVVAFAGCELATVEEKSKDETGYSMFVQVEIAGLWRVVYHKDTKVMYVVSNGGYNGGGFSVLVNPDGTPQIWDGE
jgi:hypothetical protein